MANRGRLFVISGPSGAGKSEIVKQVIASHPDIKLSVSCTTRKMRPGEVHGVNYYFLTDEEFDQKVAAGEFYEWAHVQTARYGTLKSVVNEQLDAGNDLILEIDVQGCLQAMAQDPTLTGIFVCPPGMENLEKRLRNRGTETEAQIQVRLGNVAKEVAEAYKYQYIIIHQDWSDVPNALQIAAEQVYAIITANRCALERNREFLDGFNDYLNK